MDGVLLDPDQSLGHILIHPRRDDVADRNVARALALSARPTLPTFFSAELYP
jgi:hypothetical protein